MSRHSSRTRAGMTRTCNPGLPRFRGREQSSLGSNQRVPRRRFRADCHLWWRRDVERWCRAHAEGGVAVDGGEDGGGIIRPSTLRMDVTPGPIPGQRRRASTTRALFVDAETGDDTVNPGDPGEAAEDDGAASQGRRPRGRGVSYVTSAPQIACGSFFRRESPSREAPIGLIFCRRPERSRS